MLLYRSGKSSLQESWASRVTWHQGTVITPQHVLGTCWIISFIFIFLLYIKPFFSGNLLSSDSLKDALDGVTSVVCFFLRFQE